MRRAGRQALGGAWLWLFWPAASLALVALNYLLFGAGGFQKQANGRLSPAATALLAPYLLGAWINSRLWTYRQPAARRWLPGGHLTSAARSPWAISMVMAALVDLCAELPLQHTPQHYRSLPSLDLVAPDALTCQHAAKAIERLRHKGPVLVCCALGYSRSATAVAAWLLHSGRCQSVDAAVALIRQARPGRARPAASGRAAIHGRCTTGAGGLCRLICCWSRHCCDGDAASIIAPAR